MGEKNNQWWDWGLDKEISGLVSDYLCLMLGKPPIRQNNLKTSLRFPCLGLNPIIDSIILDLPYSAEVLGHLAPLLFHLSQMENDGYKVSQYLSTL